MKKETRYCHICYKECEYQILVEEDDAELRENSHAVLWGNSHAELWGNSHAELRGNSHAVLWENSHAVLWGNSHAELWGNSHAVLWGNSHAELRGNSHAKGRSPYATGIIKSQTAKMQGGNIHGTQVIPAKQWLEKCGIEVKRGYAVLFKSVNKDFTTRNSISFKPHTRHEAPDWDSNFKEECGKGIHYCPTVPQTKTFRDEGVYVACRVKVSDMADLPAYAQYPDKIRAKGGYTLYRVNENGEKIPT